MKKKQPPKLALLEKIKSYSITAILVVFFSLNPVASRYADPSDLNYTVLSFLGVLFGIFAYSIIYYHFFGEIKTIPPQKNSPNPEVKRSWIMISKVFFLTGFNATIVFIFTICLIFLIKHFYSMNNSLIYLTSFIISIAIYSIINYFIVNKATKQTTIKTAKKNPKKEPTNNVILIAKQILSRFFINCLKVCIITINAACFVYLIGNLNSYILISAPTLHKAEIINEYKESYHSRRGNRITHNVVVMLDDSLVVKGNNWNLYDNTKIGDVGTIVSRTGLFGDNVYLLSTFKKSGSNQLDNLIQSNNNQATNSNNSASDDLYIPIAADNYINDYASMLSRDTVQKLNETLHQFEQKTSNQIVIATFPSLGNNNLEYVTTLIEQQWKIGQKDKNNGILLVIFAKEHKVRIEVGYGLEDVIPDAMAGQIIDTDLKPAFQKNNYNEGVINTVNILMQLSQQKYSSSITFLEPNYKIKFLLWFITIISFSIYFSLLKGKVSIGTLILAHLVFIIIIGGLMLIFFVMPIWGDLIMSTLFLVASLKTVPKFIAQIKDNLSIDKYYIYKLLFKIVICLTIALIVFILSLKAIFSMFILVGASVIALFIYSLFSKSSSTKQGNIFFIY